MDNKETKRIVSILFNMSLGMDYDTSVDDYKEDIEFVELNSPLGFDIRKCGRKEELLEKLNRHKTNYEVRLQNLSSDLFINQKGKTLFANSLRQDIQMFETFIKALEKE